MFILRHLKPSRGLKPSSATRGYLGMKRKSAGLLGRLLLHHAISRPLVIQRMQPVCNRPSPADLCVDGAISEQERWRHRSQDRSADLRRVIFTNRRLAAGPESQRRPAAGSRLEGSQYCAHDVRRWSLTDPGSRHRRRPDASCRRRRSSLEELSVR